MMCTVCGARLQPVESDLPFKVSGRTIVILKKLPIFQCESCSEYVIEDRVLSRVDDILAGVDHAAELEIVQYAA